MGYKNLIDAIVNNTNLITVIGIAVSASILLFQSYIQHRSNIKLQKNNLKDDIKLKLYSEIENAIGQASSAEIQAAGFLNKIKFQYVAQKSFIESGGVVTGLKITANEFMTLQNTLSDKVIQIIYLIEKYEIVQPKMRIFQNAVNVVMYDIRNYYLDFLNVSLQILAQEPPENAPSNVQAATIIKPFPSGKQMLELERVFKPYEESLSLLGSWLFDFRVEMQNLLLEHIFDNKVNRRVPLDQKYFVITTDKKNIKRLEKYFDEETNWGKNKKFAQDSVAESLHKMES